MNRAIHFSKNIAPLAIPFLLFSILIIYLRSSLYVNNNSMSLAITVDLLLTIPLVYFLLIRKTKIPKTTVIPMMIIGLLIGTYFLPKEAHIYLNLFKTWALPIIEISVVTYIILKVRAAIKKYKKHKGSSPDFFTALKSTSAEILPKALVSPFATEIAIMYYGFINWKPRKLKENEFSYHKETGTPVLLGALIFLIIVETLALHLVIAKWSTIAAWILTGLSMYTGIQVFGFARSLSKRPITINENSVTLRYGILSETKIPFTTIEKVVLSKTAITKLSETRKLSPLGDMEAHNVLLYLTTENTLYGMYGSKKKFKTIAFHVDKPKEFQEKLIQQKGYY